VEQEKNGGDQRPGVPDSDPPDEVGDCKRPGDRDVNSPDPHAVDHQKSYNDVEQHQQAKGDQKAENPAGRRRTRQHDRANLVCDGL